MSSRPSTPWTPGYVLGWSGLVSVGLITMLIGWWGVSGTAELTTLIAWLNVAIAGLTLTGIANMVWLLNGRRSVALRRTEVLRTLDVAASEAADPVQEWAAPAVLVASATMTRYHRSDCAAVQRKAVTPEPADAHEAAGRTPCRMCLA